MHVYDDTDSIGPGQIHFDFSINGTTRRWPASRYSAINSGETKTISGTSVPLTLSRTQDLIISVGGTDDDSPYADDSLGKVHRTYTSAANWGEGLHCDDSILPPNFRICYTINVTP